MTLTVSYNTGSNRVYTTIADPANGDEYSAYYQFSTAQALSTAHLGDIWLQTFPSGGTFVGPRRPTELGSFWGVTVTSTAGQTKALGSWEHYQRIMTSDATSKGQAEITPSSLSSNGKSFSLTVK